MAKDQLTDKQIAGIASRAGFKGDALVMAIAIALAESGGDASNHNPIPPDDSYGLWQINMIGSMGPARRKQYNLKSNVDLFNPDINAKVAYHMSNGGKNWSAWATYTRRKYVAFVARAKVAANAPDSSVGGTGDGSGGVVQASNPLSWPGEILDFFEFITDPITWMRAGMLLAGGALLLYGLYVLSGQSDKAKALVGTASDLLPAGKAIKAVT